MPVHYAKDTNVLRGNITFNNSKTATVQFKDSKGVQILLDSEPVVLFNIRDNGGNILNPAYKGAWQYNAANKIIGITVMFSAKTSVIVDWVIFDY